MRLVTASLCIAAFAGFGGCATPSHQLDQRQKEWEAALARHVPPGTARADAERFLAARGTPPVWLRSVSGLKDACPADLLSAKDRSAARGMFLSWDLEIHVCLEDGRVTGHRVYAFNQGF